MEGPSAPDAYARKAAACIEAMRAVDPDLVFVSSGNWDLPVWIGAGMRRIVPLVDHISHHRYTPVLQDFHGPRAAASLRAVADYPRRVRRDFARIRLELDRCTPPGRRRVGTSIRLTQKRHVPERRDSGRIPEWLPVGGATTHSPRGSSAR
jgi:hypothetical protein